MIKSIPGWKFFNSFSFRHEKFKTFNLMSRVFLHTQANSPELSLTSFLSALSWILTFSITLALYSLRAFCTLVIICLEHCLLTTELGLINFKWSFKPQCKYPSHSDSFSDPLSSFNFFQFFLKCLVFPCTTHHKYWNILSKTVFLNEHTEQGVY